MNHTQLAKVLGISREMIHRHEKAGRLTQEPDGGFDEAKARAQLAANVRQRRGGSLRRGESGPGAQARPISQPAPGLGEIPGNPRESPKIPEPVIRGPAAPSLAAIQTTHEAYRAKKTKIQVDQLEGTLINAREAELAWSGMITATRNELLSLPDNAGMKFGEECGLWLKTELRRALDNLSDYRASA